MRSQARLDPCGYSKPAPAGHAVPAPRPHHGLQPRLRPLPGLLPQSQNPGASPGGPGPLSSVLPSFSASACPGLLTRAAVPRQQPTGEQGRGRLDLWSPSSLSPSDPGMTEARSPPTGRGPRMPSLLLLPLPHRLGPAAFLTSLQALPRGAFGSERWSPSPEVGQWKRQAVDTPWNITLTLRPLALALQKSIAIES